VVGHSANGYDSEIEQNAAASCFVIEVTNHDLSVTNFNEKIPNRYNLI
jgi:hypothetical protein